MTLTGLGFHHQCRSVGWRRTRVSIWKLAAEALSLQPCNPPSSPPVISPLSPHPLLLWQLDLRFSWARVPSLTSCHQPGRAAGRERRPSPLLPRRAPGGCQQSMRSSAVLTLQLPLMKYYNAALKVTPCRARRQAGHRRAKRKRENGNNFSFTSFLTGQPTEFWFCLYPG